MTGKSPLYAVLALVVALLLASQCFFMVEPGQVAVITRQGEVEDRVYEQGLGFKIPFSQQVVYLDKRIVITGIPRQEAPDGKGGSLAVWANLLWEVSDPVAFVREYKDDTATINFLEKHCAELIQQTLSSYKSAGGARVSPASLEKAVLEELQSTLSGKGIKALEFSVSRLEPADTTTLLEAMKKSWQESASSVLSLAESEAIASKAAVERKKADILAQAIQKSLEVQGESEAQAAHILGRAFENSPREFQDFFIKMESERLKHRVVTEPPFISDN